MHKLFKYPTLMFATAFVFSVPTLLKSNSNKVSAADETISINTDEEMKQFIDDVNAGEQYLNKFVKLDSDVSISLTQAPAKGDVYSMFKGTFDGCGHTLTIDYNSTDSACALFRNNNGVIQNLIIDGTIIGGTYTATLAIYNNGTISNVTNNATVSTQNDNSYSGVSGLVYETQAGSHIQGCTNNGNISGLNTVAGIVNYISGNGEVVKCVNHGEIAASSGEFNGGVVSVAGEKGATAQVSVYKCINDGTVTGSKNSSNNRGSNGGICGWAYPNATFTGCINEGDVTSPGYGYGGIVGYLNGGKIVQCENSGTISGTYSGLGGIAGYAVAASQISQSVNRGIINNTTCEFVGGIVGVLGESTDTSTTSKNVISKCENYGEIIGGTTARSSTGGIAGWTYASGSFVYCSNYGKVTATGYGVGGIVGTAKGGTFDKCYNGGNIDCTRNADQYMGGIVGYVNTTPVSISSCLVGGTFTATKSSITKSGYLYGASGGATLSNNTIIASCSKLSSATSIGDSLTETVQDMDKVNKVIRLVRKFNCTNTNEIKEELSLALSNLDSVDQIALGNVTFYDVTEGPYKTYYEAANYIIEYIPASGFPNLFRIIGDNPSIFVPILIVSLASISLLAFVIIKRKAV